MLSLERETYTSFNKYLSKCIFDIFFHIFQQLLQWIIEEGIIIII